MHIRHEAGFVDTHVKQLGSHEANWVTPPVLNSVFPILLWGVRQYVAFKHCEQYNAHATQVWVEFR